MSIRDFSSLTSQESLRSNEGSAGCLLQAGDGVLSHSVAFRILDLTRDMRQNSRATRELINAGSYMTETISLLLPWMCV
jgi:hypothetical protein